MLQIGWTLCFIIAAAHAAVFFDASQQQSIVDAQNAAAPLNGEYVVLLDGHVSGPRAVHTGQHTILTVQDSSRENVQHKYPDAVVSEQKAVFPEQFFTAQWNLDRLDERELSALDGTWTAPENGGAGVRIYIVDDGVDGSHPDFGGRVTAEFNAFGADSCSHGTHVAGIAAGYAYGVAGGADIRSVKVLGGPQCSGTTGSLASGLSHILSTASGRRVVINLSLGFYGYDAVIDSLVQSLRSAGHIVVAAAGNDASSACNHYPSAFSGVISVAATNQNDVAASFSNYGVCVDCYAPGVSIVSARAFSTGGRELSGTSMSAPHVAGVAALIRQADSSLSGEQVVQRILQTATQGVVTNRNGSPDLLLYWAPQSGSSSAASSSSSSSTTSSTTTTTTSSVSTFFSGSSLSTGGFNGAGHGLRPSMLVAAAAAVAAAMWML